MSDKAVEAAKRLYAWASVFFGKTVVKDVFLWHAYGKVNFAVYGPAQKLKYAFRLGYDKEYEPLHSRYPINRRGGMSRLLDQAFQSQMSYYKEDEDPHVGTVIHVIETYLSEFSEIDLDKTRFTIIPEPGYPWEKEGTTFYSVKTGKWIQAPRPSWMADHRVLVDQEKKPGANWCKLAHHLVRQPSWNHPLALISRRRKIYFTHSFTLSDTKPTRDEKAIAQSILECKGLLFPSVAIGTIPGPQYLPGCLVLDPMVVLGQITKSHSYARVYSTDAWTPTTSAITNEYAYAVFAQLTGDIAVDFELSYWDHFYILGLGQEDPNSGFRPDFDILDTKAAIGLRAVQRNVSWPEKLTESIKKFENAYHLNRHPTDIGQNPSQYPYIEAKMSAIVDLNCVRIACVPDYHAEIYDNFLRASGYRGNFLPIETTADERNAFSGKSNDIENAFSRFRYAWKISRRLGEL